MYVQFTREGTEVLLKWGEFSEFKATWEDANMIKLRFPAFNLEDKVVLWGRGSATHSHPPNPPRQPILHTLRKETSKTERLVAAAI